jgi:hypothetical protein
VSRTVLVPPARVERWFHNFAGRHGAASFAVGDGRLVASAEDGSVATAALPFGRGYDGPPDPTTFAETVAERVAWGILLVRKGGFAVATVRGTQVLSSKVGRRHVQGRTKAGGQSQQRFARRRDNQARQAFEAAADHAWRILVDGAPSLRALVCGGDRHAVDEVLSDSRLARLAPLRVEPWLALPDPRASELTKAVHDGSSASVLVQDAPAG